MSSGMTSGMTSDTGTTIEDVRVADGDLQHEIRATTVVWQRELIRFWNDRTRAIVGFAQPLLFLFVLGTGLSSLVSATTPGVDFKTFLFPGVLATSTLFTAVFTGISIVWDREFGFMREMTVAPISTASIMLGKCLGGATISAGSTALLLVLCGLVGVPYDPLMLVEMVGLLFLMSFVLVALGLVLASRAKSVQSAMPMIQLAITPMMFLSGSLFPLSNLPGWLTVVTHLNPLTYAVQPMRTIVFDRIDMPAATRQALDPGIHWGDWPVPTWLQLALVAAMGMALLAAATAMFDRTE